MRTYRDGTLSLVNASTTITGVGTLFVANVGVGDIIICENSQCFEVVSVTDNTHLVVDVPAKQTGSFKYGCLRFVTAVNFRDLSVKIEQFLADRQTNLNEFTTWMTGTRTGGPASNGYYPLTNRYGVVGQFACPALLAYGYEDAQAQATAAAASASAANTSKNAAATSATGAAGSATAANTSKNAAATSATNAATSETNALASKNAAATSETNALASKNAAATSEANALTSKNAAAASATAAAASATAAISGVDKLPDNWIANPNFDPSGTLITVDTGNGKVDYVDRDAAGVPVGFSSARVARSLKKVASQLTYAIFPIVGPTSYIPTSPGQVFDISIEVAVVSGTALPAGNGSARFTVVETAMDGTSSANTRVLSYDNAKGGVQVLSGSFTTLPTTYKMTVGMWNESNMPVNALMYYGSPVIRKRDSGLALLQGRMKNMVPDPTYSNGGAAWQAVASIFDKNSASVPAGASSPHVARLTATSAISYFKFNRDPAHGIVELPARTNGIQAAEGDVFEFTGRFYLDTPTARGIRFNCDFINPANGVSNFSTPTVSLSAASGWQTITASVTVPAGMIGISPQIRLEAGTACDVYVGEIYFGRQSAADVQMVKDQLALAGLGTNAPPALDLNDTALSSGLYRYSSTALNSPFPGQSGAFIHVSYSSTYIGQLALHMGQGATVGNKLLYRSMSNGAWNTWIDLVSFADIGKMGWGPSNTDGVPIGSGVNLDTMVIPGVYGQNLSASATAILNYPAVRAGALLVMRASANMVSQMYFDYQNGRSWNRSLYNGTWSSWVRNTIQDGDTLIAPTLADAVLTGLSRFVKLANSADNTLVPSSSDTTPILPGFRASGFAGSAESTIAVQAYQYSSNNFGASFVGTRSQSGVGVHGQVPAGRSVCSLIGAASDGTDYRKVARIDFITEEATTGTSSAGKICAYTTPAGSVVPTLAVTINGAGSMYVVGGGNYGGTLGVTGKITGSAGQDLTGDLTVNGEAVVTGTLRSNYRMGVVRNGGLPYMTFARSDLDGDVSPATALIVMGLYGRTGSANVNDAYAGRLLGGSETFYLTTGGGRTRSFARNAAGVGTAVFDLDGDTATGTLTGTLITLAKIDARGSIDEATTVTVASATTTDIASAQSNTISVTGTTTITGLGTTTAGVRREVKFAGVLTLTHNATKLNLPGNANIVTAAGDVAMFTSKGSGNWDCTSYMRTAGVPLVSVSNVTTLPGSLVAGGAIDEAATQTIASAATVNLGTATSNTVTVTGTTAITSFGAETAGVRRLVKFAGALTLTHNATSLIIPGGANITTAANDVAELISLGGSNWFCYNYTRATGQPMRTVAVAQGGTGATTAAAAATNLGLGTGDSPTFNGLNVTGSIVTNSTAYVKGGLIGVWATGAASNSHLWFYDNAGNDRAVIYASPLKNVHIQCNGENVFTAETTGHTITRGSVYSGAGASWLATDGNVYGSVWGGWLKDWVKSTIRSDLAATRVNDLGSYAIAAYNGGPGPIAHNAGVGGSALILCATQGTNQGSTLQGSWYCCGYIGSQLQNTLWQRYL